MRETPLWHSYHAHGITRNFTLEDVHVEGTERIAEAVAKYDIDRFIHVSSYNADSKSPSEFFRTKVKLFATPLSTVRSDRSTLGSK